MNLKNAKVIAISITLAFALLCFSVFLFRNAILHHFVGSAQKTVYAKYKLELKFKSIYFSKFDAIAFENVELKDSTSNEIFSVEHANIEVLLPSLLLARVRIKSIDASNIKLYIFDKNGLLNLKKIKAINSKGHTKALSKEFILTKAIKYLAVFSSTYISIKQTELILKDTIGSEQILIPQLELNHGIFAASFSNKLLEDTLNAAGTFDINNKRLECTLSHTSETIGAFTFLRKSYNLNLSFDSVYFNTKWDVKNNRVDFKQNSKLKNLQIEHWRLAQQPIVFDDLNSEISGSISEQKLQVDSTSIIQVKRMPLHFFTYAEKQDSNFYISLKVEMPEIEANDFFISLPDGMFNSLKGISCIGKLAYRLNFKVDSKNLDALVFESEMKKKNFSLNHFGAEKLTKINDDFLHEVFMDEKLVRKIFVGKSNFNFTPYSAISPYLIASVLQSEDPSFLQHAGFVESAFREAIIQDIKERRFARGGSTITMQLVKNVFLSRDKNISRKVEEALIVYLLENLRLVSKERMLEVYLNIIEWGPNIYGIGEAANFYFNKKPSALNLQESIFLAGIIPNPKYFKYQVDSTGKFKPHFERFAHILMNRMLLRNRIADNDTAMFLPEVKFYGTALKYISPADFDSLQKDDLMIENVLPPE